MLRESRDEIDGIRRLLKVSEAEFARRLGVGIDRLNRLLSGQEEPTEQDVQRFLNLTPAGLRPLIDFDEWIRRARAVAR